MSAVQGPVAQPGRESAYAHFIGLEYVCRLRRGYKAWPEVLHQLRRQAVACRGESDDELQKLRQPG
ncbi:MAG: hypothetical protein PVG63_05705 [Anaerolineales bacterium]